MQPPIQDIWDQLTPQQRTRILHILVQMLLHQVMQAEEAQDECNG
jgi:hypothetical protein